MAACICGEVSQPRPWWVAGNGVMEHEEDVMKDEEEGWVRESQMEVVSQKGRSEIGAGSPLVGALLGSTASGATADISSLGTKRPSKRPAPAPSAWPG